MQSQLTIRRVTHLNCHNVVLVDQKNKKSICIIIFILHYCTCVMKLIILKISQKIKKILSSRHTCCRCQHVAVKGATFAVKARIVRCKPTREKKYIYLFIQRDKSGKRNGRWLRPAFVAIAIGDKDFIVSRSNRKTVQTARANEIGKGARERGECEAERKEKSVSGVTTKRLMLNGCEFFGASACVRMRKMHNPQSELKARVSSV